MALNEHPEWHAGTQIVPGNNFRWGAIKDGVPEKLGSARALSYILGAVIITFPPYAMINALWIWILEFLWFRRGKGLPYYLIRNALLLFALPVLLIAPAPFLNSLGWNEGGSDESSIGWDSPRVIIFILSEAMLVFIVMTHLNEPILKVCLFALLTCYLSMWLTTINWDASTFGEVPPPRPLQFTLTQLMLLVLGIGIWGTAVVLILRA